MTEAGVEAAEVSVPAEFFADILPRVDDLAELKLILSVIRLVAHGRKLAVPVADMESPVMLRQIVGQGSPEPSEERLRRVVDRAVADGWLLRYTVHASGRPETYLFLSTAQNRELLDRLRGDDGEVARMLEIPDAARVTVYRPNVFALYEHHIGPLTPLIAEQLRDAERLYPRFWLEEAMRQAVQYNKRNWRYMSAILARWEVTGGPDEIPRRRS